MSIGMKRGTVFLEPHQTEWEIAAKEAIRTIKSILGDIAADIQHIGSTSIKAIKAKPIIDIAVAVNDFEAVLQKRAELEKVDVIFRFDERPEQLLGNTAYIKKIIDSKEKHPATKPSVIRVSYFMLTR